MIIAYKCGGDGVGILNSECVVCVFDVIFVCLFV